MAGIPSIWQELVDIANERGGQSGNDIGEVRQRFDSVKLATGDEAEDRRSGLAAGRTSNKQPVFRLIAIPRSSFVVFTWHG